MKEKYLGIFWGLVLIVVGAWFLVTEQTRFVIRDPYLGLALTAGLSVLFFASYFISGPKRWGWLFPACIFAGTTLTIALSLFAADAGGWIAAPVFLGIAAPFLVAYFQEPETRRWALIPAYVMGALTLVVCFADSLPGELMGTLVLMAIALPFLVVYLTGRDRKWALIPFGVLAGISLIPLLTLIVKDELIGVAIMFLFAAPFAVVYLQSERNWWALIPAGIFATIGVVVMLTLTYLDSANDLMAERVAGGLLFLGFSLTFLALWTRRNNTPTAWASYPAAALGALSAAAFIGGMQVLTYIWPLALIAGGVTMLYNNYRSKPV